MQQGNIVAKTLKCLQLFVKMLNEDIYKTTTTTITATTKCFWPAYYCLSFVAVVGVVVVG